MRTALLRGIGCSLELGIGIREGQRFRLGKIGLQTFKDIQLFAGRLYWVVLPASHRTWGRYDFRTVGDKTAVEDDHAKESSELASSSRVGVFS